MEKTLALQGHPTRGKEVIEILEILEGQNISDIKGNGSYLYYIDGNNFISMTSQYQANFIIFTLEQFLEKYLYKVGDKVQNIITKDNHEIVNINHDYYILENNCCLKCSDQNNYIKEKFGITTLKPYDKVLVRFDDLSTWKPQLFSYLDTELKYNCYKFALIGRCSTSQCIPYEGNEHLVGTTNECDEYYKTWK